jgi:hypothetical protein
VIPAEARVALSGFFHAQQPAIRADPDTRIRAAAPIAIHLEAVEKLPVAVHILHFADAAVDLAVERIEHVPRHVAEADVLVEVADAIINANAFNPNVHTSIAIVIPIVTAAPRIGAGERRDRRGNPQSQGR